MVLTGLKPMDIKQITDERMREWANGLTVQGATPVLVLGVGHGDSRGEVHMIVAENIAPALIQKLLDLCGLEVKADLAREKLKDMMAANTEGVQE